MLRYLFFAVGLVAIAVAMWTIVIRNFAQPSVAVEWVRDIYQRKELAARRIKSNKVVIIGGSGSHFGFSAEYLTRLTGIPAVNLGTMPGLVLSIFSIEPGVR